MSKQSFQVTDFFHFQNLNQHFMGGLVWGFFYFILFSQNVFILLLT